MRERDNVSVYGVAKKQVCHIDLVSIYGVASRRYVREYQFTHHRSRYSNKLLHRSMVTLAGCYAID